MRRIAIAWLATAAACGRVNFGYPLVPCEEVVGNATALWGDNEHCYTRHDLTAGTFGARNGCASIGGHLATITSPEENETLRAGLAITEPTRLGLVTGGFGGTDWTWQTSEPAPFSSWDSGEPILCPSEASTVTIGADGNWASNCFGDDVPYACEIEPWLVRDDGHAYRMSWDETNWFSATAACDAFGAHLAVISSVDELTFVAPIVIKSAYLGGLGNDGVFEWTTGEAFGSFTAWDNAQPDEAGTSCIVQQRQEQAWADVRCSAAYAALCEREP